MKILLSHSGARAVVPAAKDGVSAAVNGTEGDAAAAAAGGCCAMIPNVKAVAASLMNTAEGAAASCLNGDDVIAVLVPVSALSLLPRGGGLAGLVGAGAPSRAPPESIKSKSRADFCECALIVALGVAHTSIAAAMCKISCALGWAAEVAPAE